MIAYVSRVLTSPEHNCSVIQQQCLSVLYALKHFRHYLLGRAFKLMTDHAPVQWLSAQKMEGPLCRWALALQEYDFSIIYRKGTQNGKADALSRCNFQEPTVVHSSVTMASQANLPDQICSAQHDPTINQFSEAITTSQHQPNTIAWREPPLHPYRHVWSWLMASYIDSTPTSDVVTLPILPASLHKHSILQPQPTKCRTPGNREDTTTVATRRLLGQYGKMC